MAKYKTQHEASLIARKIAALPKMDSIDQFAPIILEIMDGVDYRVWHVLDEKSGLFNWNDRFYMLRQVRNHPAWGRIMFDSLTG